MNVIVFKALQAIQTLLYVFLKDLKKKGDKWNLLMNL